MRRAMVSTAAIARLFAVPAAARTPAACDRPCLAGVMTAFLDAVIAHAPKAAPLGGTVNVDGGKLHVAEAILEGPASSGRD